MKDTSERLGTLPIHTLIIKLSLPSILAQIVNVAYNITDRIYLGHISENSTEALTGVGITLPILLIISAFAMLAGFGGSPLFAIALGRSQTDSTKKQEALCILGNATIIILLSQVMCAIVFSLCMSQVLRLFGASNAIMPYAKNYLRIYLIGVVFSGLSVGLNPYIAAQGHAKTAMCSVLIGAVLNMTLDPVFIFKFNMGVKGAAIATIASQAVSFLWIIIFLSSSKSTVRLTKTALKPNLNIIKKIAALGASPFTMTGTESAIFVVLNYSLVHYGTDMYVACMTILQSLMQLCFVPLQGFTQGVQPIISYNYGARKLYRVRNTVCLMLAICVIATVLAYLTLALNAKTFVSFFSNEQSLILLTAEYLPIYFGAMSLFGVQMAAQSTFVALGKAKTSFFVAVLRKIILLIPLALILPIFMGVRGVFFSEPIASCVSAITAGVLLFFYYKKHLCKL